MILLSSDWSLPVLERPRYTRYDIVTGTSSAHLQDLSDGNGMKKISKLQPTRIMKTLISAFNLHLKPLNIRILYLCHKNLNNFLNTLLMKKKYKISCQFGDNKKGTILKIFKVLSFSLSKQNFGNGKSNKVIQSRNLLISRKKERDPTDVTSFQFHINRMAVFARFSCRFVVENVFSTWSSFCSCLS